VWYTGEDEGEDVKFHKTSKIERLVSKDPTQRILENPWLDVERGVILSSPGQSAIMIPVVVEEGDVSGPVPVEGLKEIRKNDGSMSCTKEYCIVNGVAYPRAQQFDSYPPVENLIVPTDDYVGLAINAKSLAELAQGMGTDVVRLRIQTTPEGTVVEGAPVVVTPHPHEAHVDGAMGALLPFRVARV
jgi:hypothetical protein